MSSLTWRHVLFGLALYLCAPLYPVYAQEVGVGDRIRVQARQTGEPDGSSDTPVFKTTGELTGWANDSLWIDSSGHGSIPIHLSSVEKLEVSDGRSSNAGKGMVTGTVIGGFVGFSLVLSAAAAFGDLSDAFSSDGLKYVVVGAGVGFVIGTAVGALSSGDAWREVTLGDLRVAVAPNGLTFRVPVQGR